MELPKENGMQKNEYLQWLSGSTDTAWWHDSGDPEELQQGLANGAVGVTTNPVLCAQALKKNKDLWRTHIQRALDTEKSSSAKAESLMRIVVVEAAKQLEPIHRKTQGKLGYVCAQVDPSLAGDREAMYAMAKRFNAWAPNIAVKLPATAAGLDVMEKCCAEGITVTVTVSFCVPQVYAAGKRYQEIVRKRKAGSRVGKCFAVIMIGRLDDYLREVFSDNKEAITEQEVQLAGLSVVKNAYRLYRENGYEAVLLIAALRGNYHMTALAGGNLIMSIHPVYQKSLQAGPVVFEKQIAEPVPGAVLEKLNRAPEFRRAYDPEGLSENEMITFGPTQRTLSQFTEIGWKALQEFQL
jgi:transaldolase